MCLSTTTHYITFYNTTKTYNIAKQDLVCYQICKHKHKRRAGKDPDSKISRLPSQMTAIKPWPHSPGTMADGRWFRAQEGNAVLR